jgi:branched-chain amino acid transport system permease protein
VFAVSLNLLLGYAGQVSVASAAFGAVGGYAMGYLVMVHGWNYVPAVLVGAVAALVIGTVVALPALRLSVEFLILLTLAVSLVTIGIFTTFPVLGGTYGLIGIPQPELFGWELLRPRDWIIPLLVVAVVIYLICYRMGESAYGRVLKGLREDPDATRSLGKNVFAYKVSVFAVTSAMAGLAGGLYSGYLQLATPSVYSFDTSLKIFAIVIFGGIANLAGSVFGAIVVIMTEPLLERQPFIELDARDASLIQLIIYGLLLVVLMMLRPQGVVPEGFSIWRWLKGERHQTRRIEMEQEGWVPDVDTAALAVTSGDSQTVREQEWQEATAVLQVRGLSKRFGGIVAAEALDMDLHKGTITALVGPNGAGKTTVFNLLTGFIRPDAGSVMLNGVELRGRSPEQIARMGMVRSFQDVRIIPRLSCLQNVMLAIQDQVGERSGPLFFAPGRANAD